jgi:hypothetical protein
MVFVKASSYVWPIAVLCGHLHSYHPSFVFYPKTLTQRSLLGYLQGNILSLEDPGLLRHHTVSLIKLPKFRRIVMPSSGSSIPRVLFLVSSCTAWSWIRRDQDSAQRPDLFTQKRSVLSQRPCKGKKVNRVNFTLEEAMKAQTTSKDIAVFFL